MTTTSFDHISQQLNIVTNIIERQLANLKTLELQIKQSKEDNNKIAVWKIQGTNNDEPFILTMPSGHTEYETAYNEALPYCSTMFCASKDNIIITMLQRL